MTHGSLFSGIGGFDLAASWMGWENIFHCEWNPFGQKVLKHHFPKSISYDDITKTDFTIHRGTIDILTGGFPCQPYSLAGKRKGKEDERHLWPEMLRAIREIQPRFVVGENVFGLINWSNGLVFHEVQTDLETEGYEVWPYVLPACAVNAPHRRDRVWFVAYRNIEQRERKERGFFTKSTNGGNSSTSNTSEQRCNNGGDNRQERHIQTTGEWQLSENLSERNGREFGISEDGSVGTWNATNSNGNGLNGSNCEHEIKSSEGRFDALGNIEQMGNFSSTYTTPERLQRGSEINKWEKYDFERRRNGAEFRTSGENNDRYTGTNFENFPTQSPICGGDDGLPTNLDGITFSKWRNESIKAFGNAIVPQVAYQIFQAIDRL